MRYSIYRMKDGKFLMLSTTVALYPTVGVVKLFWLMKLLSYLSVTKHRYASKENNNILLTWMIGHTIDLFNLDYNCNKMFIKIIILFPDHNKDYQYTKCRQRNEKVTFGNTLTSWKAMGKRLLATTAI